MSNSFENSIDPENYYSDTTSVRKKVTGFTDLKKKPTLQTQDKQEQENEYVKTLKTSLSVAMDENDKV